MTAAVVGGFCLAALLFLGTADRLIAVHPYLAQDGMDDRPFVTMAVLKASLAATDAPKVIFLGASSMREAIARPVADTALAGIYGSGTRPEVIHLTAGGQTLWEMLAIIDALEPALHGSVVIGVNPTLFSYDPASLAESITTARMGFASPALDAEARAGGIEVPRRTGLYLWDQRSYFLSRMLIARFRIFEGPASAQAHRFDGREPVADSVFERAERIFTKYVGLYERNHDYHTELLGRIVKHVQAKGVRVVLVETPVNPAWLERPIGKRWYQTHVTHMTKTAGQWAVPYIHLDDSAVLSKSDFYDITHIGSSRARVRYTQVLTRRLTDELTRAQ